MNTITPSEAAQKAAQHLGSIAALARALGLSDPTVHQWTTGVRRVPAERCPEIEAITNGAVRAEELRPDVPWHVIRGKPSKQVAACLNGDR